MVYNDSTLSVFPNTFSDDTKMGKIELFIGMLNEPFIDIEKVGINYKNKDSYEVYEPSYITFMGVKNVKSVKYKIKRTYKGLLFPPRNTTFLSYSLMKRNLISFNSFDDHKLYSEFLPFNKQSTFFNDNKNRIFTFKRYTQYLDQYIINETIRYNDFVNNNIHLIENVISGEEFQLVTDISFLIIIVIIIVF